MVGEELGGTEGRKLWLGVSYERRICFNFKEGRKKGREEGGRKKEQKD